MAAHSERLLGPLSAADAVATPQPWRRRSVAALTLVAAATAAASGLAALLAGEDPGQGVAPSADAVSLQALARSGGLRPNFTSLAPMLDADCYAFTGVSCKAEGCGAQGNATCDDGQCVCTVGGCAGVDGVCRPHSYDTVGPAEGFELYNAMWRHQHMYMPAMDPFNEVKTTIVPTVLGFGRDKWVLHRLHGASDPRAYLLSTIAFPGWVARIKKATGFALNRYGAYETALSDEETLASLAVRVCLLDNGMIKIGSYGDPVRWFYAHHGSWYVLGWGLTDDPGDGGYWLPSPPLPTGELDLCS